MNRSKNATQLEEPFVMAGVADAAANQDRTKPGLGEKSQNTVTREARGGGIVIHFANFAGGVDVHLFSHEGGQGEDLVKIADAPEEILVAEEFDFRPIFLKDSVFLIARGGSTEKLRCAGA